jgi:Undecaprenyl-phosphate glucose phosphotransferase
LGTPPFLTYIELLLPLWVIWGLVSIKIHFYQPRRIEHFSKEILEIGKTLTLTLLLLIAATYLFKKFEFSRLAFFYFWVMAFFGLASARFFARKGLKILRKRGYKLRFAILAGTGELGQKILEKIDLYPELGIEVIGFLTRKAEEVEKQVRNVPILGVYEDLDKIMGENKVDIFFIALPINEYVYLESLIKKLRGHLADVKVVPGAYEFLGLRGGVDELDDLPIVSLQSSPLYGWNRVSKRIFDLVLGALILVFAFPIMVIISFLVKFASAGPIFYRQERVGMDGRSFQMLKFRTMRVDAEKETGPVWAKEKDPRRTRVGTFLRKTSLDELPQLFNVMKGEMSLVGPRPERPIFVEKFRDRIPSYMLRHKIKAGMTGWAQVNGWRGNTSIEKRIEHDLYYIQNWSIGFDLKILFMTFWKGFFSKSAY